jgi:hypothetical protein
MTYQDIVIKSLYGGDILNVTQIMEKMDISKCKTVYVIDAIKKGIKSNIIIKHENVNSKTLYKDHHYSLTTS